MGDDRVVAGIVKWFDAAKGFGFIVADEIESDILLHANVLRNFGRSSLVENSEIEVEIQETDRGVQASAILSITPAAGSGIDGYQTGALQNDVYIDPDAPLEPARVKWFDRAKGFGFLNVFGSSDDIFVHMEVLHQSGLADLQPGEAICVATTDGPRGRMAQKVWIWDHAAEGED